MGKPFNVKFEVHLNKTARMKTQEAIFMGIRDAFELDIVPEAKRLSPVRKIMAKVKSKIQWIPGGTNKRSIDCEVTQTTRGIVARLFTQSGYGGYLELGTRNMPARPYLYPAFLKFQSRIASVVGARFKQVANMLR